MNKSNGRMSRRLEAAARARHIQIIQCRDCAYFESEQRELVDQIFLARNICKKWGEGCLTLPGGYCFLGKEKEQKRHDRN